MFTFSCRLSAVATLTSKEGSSVRVLRAATGHLNRAVLPLTALVGTLVPLLVIYMTLGLRHSPFLFVA